MTLFWLPLLLVAVIAFAYRRASLGQTALLAALMLAPLLLLPSVLLPWRILAGVTLLALLVLNVDALRRLLVTRPLLGRFRRAMPTLSETERQALEAGTVWWEGDLFAGDPRWDRLLGTSMPQLTTEERAFLEGPVEELCALLDDWQITHLEGDLPAPVWEFLKTHGFFAMIIPQRYGGLEFSAYAHSCVLATVASRSITAASTIAVPNSLGPAELLLKYGTDEQREHYLPRLASGEEIPCFALTSTVAGSDAASLTDVGEVCRDFWEGEEVLGIRLDFDKRYITLAPVATVIGLAFRLRDPQRLLGDEADLGITCALVPVSAPGVSTGRRHFPIATPFQNGPVTGRDVFIPIEFIIGGPERAGDGWRMLMECLSVGRGVSLPSNATGGARMALAATSAYAALRRQFGLPLARFEGIKAPLARLAGNVYLMEAARRMTLAAIDLGEEPAVASAIMKHHITELGRQVANDAMDIHGGKAVMLGPSNYLARGYQSVPIMITVEGANILTRSLIIFGQGALRCHPWLLREMHATLAATGDDTADALARFDEAVRGHVGHAITMASRSLIDGLTGGRLLQTPGEGQLRRFYQQATRLASSLAIASEICLLVYGASLKRHEAISARLGDVLSALFLASAALKRFEDEGSPEEDTPLLRWCIESQLHAAQGQLQAVGANLPGPLVRAVYRLLVLPRGMDLSPPDDATVHATAELVSNYSDTRLRLIEGTYLKREASNPVGLLDELLEKDQALAPAHEKLRTALREGKIRGETWRGRIQAAGRAGVLELEQVRALLELDERFMALAAVDDFDTYELGTRRTRRPVKGARSIAGT